MRGMYARWWVDRSLIVFPIVLCAVSGSRRMANIWLRAVIVQRKYMIQRRVRKPGVYFLLLCPVSYRLHHNLFAPLSIPMSLHFFKLTPQTFFFFSHNSVLADESAGKSCDLYIRSVCFSPDGKFLATGAEDKQIRVSIFFLAIGGSAK